ncbi:MAG: NAD+ synthase [Thermodesulfobacteriota bacterium]
MSKTIRVVLSQINTCVGALESNVSKIIEYIDAAKAQGADIVCFPELAVTGYPPEDLLLKPSFIEDNIKALQRVKEASGSITVIVGFVDKQEDIYNAAAVIHNGEIVDVYHKRYLPNYSVFDENRYFQCGMRSPVYRLNGTLFGVNICEDVWYPGDPIREQAVLGNAEIIFNISSSPYYVSKVAARERMLCTRARDNSTFMVFTNLVGGQDELVFDGHSAVIDERGEVVARAPAFEEKLLVVDINTRRVFRTRLHDPRRRKERAAQDGLAAAEPIALELLKKGKRRANTSQSELAPFLKETEEVWRALVVGTRDYAQKNGFERVVIGISGGIDSALVAAIAVEALGAGNVVGVSMPSQYSSKGSVDDTEALCANLGITINTIPVEKIFSAYLEMLTDHFGGAEPDVTEENIQARIRGNLLMALSNKFGWLVLTTANKSETSVGYTTLYGDMAGGFAVIKDVSKTLVYRLAKYCNEMKGEAVIPEEILRKPPSAELRPAQLDADTLPPYEVLDPILKAYVEDDLSTEEIASGEFDASLVEGVVRMVDSNEYKRRQGPPGIKITARAFGKDRRFPITNRYSE